jgi:hypothetical protein
MKIHQLSVFVENKPGHLITPCRLLAKAGINIVTLSLAETQNFGILRLIVRDWQKAKQVVESAGFTANVTEVLAIEVGDAPGGLADVLEPIEKAGLNVEYMYAFATKLGDKAVLVFRFEDPDAALRVLSASNQGLIRDVETFARLERG